MPTADGTPGRPIRRFLEERFNLTEIVSLLTSFGLFPAELDTRRPLGEAVSEALARPFPSYARWPRVLGILSFLLLAFLAVTGTLLAFYYQPTVTEAHASVTTIVRDVHFGWFMHQAHVWGAALFVVILTVRLWRFYFQGLYKAPREALWIVGVLTLVVAFQADLTGRLLVWDARGYWTVTRALEILTALPILGPAAAYFIGGTTLDPLVLTRFYFLHVAMLPALLLLLFYLHFSGVRRVGLSAVAGERPGGPGVYRAYLYNLLILTVVLFAGLVTLVTLLPVPFRPPADPFSTPPGVRPPWYLLASHALIESFPAFVPRPVRGVVLEGLLAVVLLLPFLDRSPGRTLRDRPVAVAAGIAALLIWMLLTWRGYLLEVAR